jgi:hypothetical protein
MNRRTRWRIEPSFAFDLLGFFNALSGDPFYLAYHRVEYDTFAPRLGAAAHAALAGVKRTIKDEGGEIVSAVLCYLFSGTADRTLDDVLGTVAGTRPPPAARGDDPTFRRFLPPYEAARPDLEVALLALRAAGFEDYWRREIAPRIEDRCRGLDVELAPYDVVAEVERVLGAPHPAAEYTVYVLCYTRPHGVALMDRAFLTDHTWSREVVVRAAAHELMHPPYDLDGEEGLRDAIGSLAADPLLRVRFDGHDPDYGYNTFDGYIEEGCVRALDQLVAERLGVARDPRERWLQEDGGMHVFAACLYDAMREEGDNARGERFGDFLARQIATGLAPGTIEPRYRRFYGGSTISSPAPVPPSV